MTPAARPMRTADTSAGSSRRPPGKPSSRTDRLASRPFPLVFATMLAAAAFAVFALICVLVTCLDNSSNERAAAEYTSPYDWSGLRSDGERLAYYEDGELRSKPGIDVSSHQGDIDWHAVANDGIEFAIVRLGNRGYTEGSLYTDERATSNLDGAKEAGIDTGAYFFSQAVSVEEAVEEAEFALSLLEGRRLDLPVVYDHEPVPEAAGRANHMTGEELAACARAFCERIEQAGYRTMIYGNKQDISRFDDSSFGERPVWFAEYDVAAPTGQFDFVMWQYTSAGSVAGIPTTVDLNISFVDALQ